MTAADREFYFTQIYTISIQGTENKRSNTPTDPIKKIEARGEVKLLTGGCG
jgi:hypothetical protein